MSFARHRQRNLQAIETLQHLRHFVTYRGFNDMTTIQATKSLDKGGIFCACDAAFGRRKAEDAQVSDVYSFLGSKRLVDPVPQQHHAMPCDAMRCCYPWPSLEVLQGDHAVLCCIGSDSEANGAHDIQPESRH